MASAATAVMTLAVAFGSALALWHLRASDGGPRPPALAGIAHGAIGAAGLAVVLLALRGPARGVAAGAGSFGTIAAGLFAAALATGLVLLVLRRRRAAMTMAVHSGFAIAGYVLLLAWNALG